MADLKNGIPEEWEIEGISFGLHILVYFEQSVLFLLKSNILKIYYIILLFYKTKINRKCSGTKFYHFSINQFILGWNL